MCFLFVLDDFYGSDKDEIGKNCFGYLFINVCDFLKFRKRYLLILG